MVGNISLSILNCSVILICHKLSKVFNDLTDSNLYQFIRPSSTHRHTLKEAGQYRTWLTVRQRVTMHCCSGSLGKMVYPMTSSKMVKHCRPISSSATVQLKSQAFLEIIKKIYIHAGGQLRYERHILYYPNQYILVQVSCIEFDEVNQHVQVWAEKIGFCNCWYPKQHELSYLLRV